MHSYKMKCLLKTCTHIVHLLLLLNALVHDESYGLSLKCTRIKSSTPAIAVINIPYSHDAAVVFDVIRNCPVEDGRVSTSHVTEVIDTRILRLHTRGNRDTVGIEILPLSPKLVIVTVSIYKVLQ